MRSVLLVLLAAALPGVGPAAAQTATPDQAPPQQSVACPPGAQRESPTTGKGNSKPLSDKLAQSNGVICPPTSVDPQMQVPPPGGGRLKVLPPPGTPGGDQNVQPK
jgi:hypothetical protein